MSNLNRVSLQGNLVEDPELVGAEKNVVRFTVAVNNGYGENENTAFVPCVAFGKTAQIIAEHFQKGRQIIVNGALTQNRWENKEGEKRSRLELRLSAFEGFHFVGSNGGNRQISEGDDDKEPAAATAGDSDGSELF